MLVPLQVGSNTLADAPAHAPAKGSEGENGCGRAAGRCGFAEKRKSTSNEVCTGIPRDARHVNYVTPLGMGRAVVITGGQRRTAACIGGMVSVMNGEVTLVPTTFEWAESIDAARAAASQQRAEAILSKTDASDTELKLAQARLHRALVRQSVASSK